MGGIGGALEGRRLAVERLEVIENERERESTKGSEARESTPCGR